MLFNASDHILVIDLEATCCENGEFPTSEMETIEVGAVMLSAESWRTVGEFQSFVKPVRHPKLTDFCARLTTISQDEIDSAPPFPTVMRQLQEFVHGYSCVAFGSWGQFDADQLVKDATYHGVALTLVVPHLNLKKMFGKRQGVSSRLGMARALAIAGITLQGTHHRGIDDARSTALLVPYILGGNKVPIGSTTK